MRDVILALDHNLASKGLHIRTMANFVFTCPATKRKVQHQLDHDPYLTDNEYEVIICPSCTSCRIAYAPKSETTPVTLPAQ